MWLTLSDFTIRPESQNHIIEKAAVRFTSLGVAQILHCCLAFWRIASMCISPLPFGQ